MRQCSWLRHYVSSRKVADSSTNEVSGFFNRPDSSSRTTVLGSNQPLTEMRTRKHPGGKRRPEHKANNLTVICEPIVYKNAVASTSHNPRGLHGQLQGFLYIFTIKFSVLPPRPGTGTALPLVK
jgi:hypothetical protein